MNLSLYNIETDYIKIKELLLENGGELTPELEESLVINEQNLITKGTNYAFVIKELDQECSIIDSEIERLEALKKTRIKTKERLKDKLATAMILFNIEEIKTPIIKVSFRKSESTEITNPSLLESEYLVEKLSISPDKEKIKAAIKEGKTVYGAVLKTNLNLQIK